MIYSTLICIQLTNQKLNHQLSFLCFEYKKEEKDETFFATAIFEVHSRYIGLCFNTNCMRCILICYFLETLRIRFDYVLHHMFQLQRQKSLK